MSKTEPTAADKKFLESMGMQEVEPGRWHSGWQGELPEGTSIDNFGAAGLEQLNRMMHEARAENESQIAKSGEPFAFTVRTMSPEGVLEAGVDSSSFTVDDTFEFVNTLVTFGGMVHLMMAHTSSEARKSCNDYRQSYAVLSRDLAAMRKTSGQPRGGGHAAATRNLARKATDAWRETVRGELSETGIDRLPLALRFSTCFTHAFCDVLMDEFGESADDNCGVSDQNRLDLLAEMWLDLHRPRVKKPESRKARQKAEAKSRAAAKRKGN
ncbi:MAG TPA: hypothetical protein VF885_23235 [Arthrobacter sp.]